MDWFKIKIGDLVQYTDEHYTDQYQGIGIITERREGHGCLLYTSDAADE